MSAVSGPTTEAGGTATFTIVLDAEPAADVTIDLSSSDLTEGTVSPTSLTFAPAGTGIWSTPQTVTVTGVDDFVDDGDIAYPIVTDAATSTDVDYSGINATDPSITNNDDETVGITVGAVSGPTTEAGGTATFTVVLDSEPSADVTVDLASSDLTEGTVSPASLTFTQSGVDIWSTVQTVTVTGVDDFVDDGDIAYSIVTAAATSTDVTYSGVNAADAPVTNNDDETAGATVSPVSGPTTEAGGTATFTVVLDSEPTADVTIGLSSNDLTEGTVSPASVTFAPSGAGIWSTPQTVTVSGVDDFVDDGDIGFAIVTAASTSTDPGYSGLDPADAPVTNNDDETAGITLSAVSGPTTEAGGTATFTIVLDSEPTADVTLGLTSTNTAEGTVLPTSLTFTAAGAGIWNTPQTVTVTGVDDLVADGSVVYAITTAAATSADANYSGFDAPDASITNVDDETVGVTVTARQWTNDRSGWYGNVHRGAEHRADW